MGALLRRLALAVLFIAVASGCNQHGTVVQGRAVACDPTGRTVTLVLDTSHDPARPRFDGLPPETFRFPLDPREMGPLPRPGRRLRIDPDNSQMTLYNPATKACDTIALDIVSRKDNVKPTDPLVLGQTLPAVNDKTHIVTVYCPLHSVLLSFLPPESYRDLGPEDWAAGDVVRIYFKTAGKAQRLMNVTRTDISKK